MADVRSQIAANKKIVAKLYERTVVPEPVVEIMFSTFEMPIIWQDSTDG